MKDILLDFGIPAIIIVGCLGLIALGRDGEVKSILTMAAGWAFHAGVRRRNGSNGDNEKRDDKTAKDGTDGTVR